MDVVYLTVDGVIELHAIALEHGGGLDGIRSQQQLASAVGQPQQSAFGEDLYPTIPEKAAAYGFFITEGQPFIDANKRTGLLALETFLEANGYELVEDDDAVAQVFEDLGAKNIDQSEFFGWVCNHARPRRDSKVIDIRRE